MKTANLTFVPDNVLTFDLKDDSPAQACLRVTNDSTVPVVFKVKTTNPECYLVKPNHGLVARRETIHVAVVVVKLKKKNLLARVKAQGSLKCPDKFLVQSASVNESLLRLMETKSQSEIAELIGGVLGSKDKHEMHAKKLLVDFRFHDDQACSNVLGAAEGVTTLAGRTGLESTQPVPMPGTPEAMFTEIVTLRKKYDDLVAFTVNLTAERDMLSVDLVKAKDISARECSSAVDKNLNRNRNKICSAVSFWQVILLGCFSFFLGISIPTVGTFCRNISGYH
mmetsp:Transcript_21776/g.68220  ORF Transcript_21776/g.68220 Transcript_21776/m.68220 type:complete len:281 (-) Transcript_21776:404-1246(-)|eukprot:CAMPEP_0197395474 /NCGR_PEP_ID=MMETSP1165-20131217/7102_1 /TAXON_ID=284809 /ORGANISM="Chrysocystis fragilis, Strain CCMP3189" /LENGTH=280 /DNA_ID=CAMNT_0042921237 /DNA_START=261 /DNA_END=1103 /DNA_ORIENTATION=+